MAQPVHDPKEATEHHEKYAEDVKDEKNPRIAAQSAEDAALTRKILLKLDFR